MIRGADHPGLLFVSRLTGRFNLSSQKISQPSRPPLASDLEIKIGIVPGNLHRLHLFSAGPAEVNHKLPLFETGKDGADLAFYFPGAKRQSIDKDLPDVSHDPTGNR